jgi:hypothetical protein
VALAVAGLSGSVEAQCDTSAVDPGAPLRTGPGPASFGSLPEACPAYEIALQADAAALIAFEDFFGALEAGAALRGRYALSDRAWLSLWFPGIAYRFVANATVEADSLDLGAGAVGLHFGLPLGAATQVSPFVRVLAPTESVFVNATRHGVEHGLSVVHAPWSRVELLSGLAFPLLVTDSYGSLHAVLSPTLGAQASVTAFSWLVVLGGASLRVRSGDAGGFDAFEPVLGARLLPWRGLRIELGARAPLWGDDRSDLGLTLNVGYLFPRGR